MDKNRIYLVITLLLLGFFFGYFFFLNDYWAYQSAVQSDSKFTINRYLLDFPEGRYTDVIKRRLDSVSYFSDVREDSSEESVQFYVTHCQNGEYMEDVMLIDLIKRPSLAKAQEFQMNFLQSQRMSTVKGIVDRLWENEIKAFRKNKNKKGVDRGKFRFFEDLLGSMKAAGNNRFIIKFNHKKYLKEFDDYTEEQRSFSDLMALLSESPKPSESEVYEVKSNFSSPNINQLENDVSEAIQKELNSVFSYDFFEFETLNSDSELREDANDVVILINYKIENEDDEYGNPVLWTHTRNNRFSGYVLSLDVDFSLTIQNPSNKETLNSKMKGDPGSQIKNVSDLSMMYNVMITRSFDTFVEKVGREIGLMGGAGMDNEVVSSTE